MSAKNFWEHVGGSIIARAGFSFEEFQKYKKFYDKHHCSECQACNAECYEQLIECNFCERRFGGKTWCGCETKFLKELNGKYQGWLCSYCTVCATCGPCDKIVAICNHDGCDDQYCETCLPNLIKVECCGETHYYCCEGHKPTEKRCVRCDDTLCMHNEGKIKLNYGPASLHGCYLNVCEPCTNFMIDNSL